MGLVDEIKADKAAGTRRLVAEYGNRLYETAIHLCGREADAEDYVFRTFEKAVSRIAQFKGRSSLFTWMYEIMFNIIRTDARRKGANALVFQEARSYIEDALDETLSGGVKHRLDLHLQHCTECRAFFVSEKAEFARWCTAINHGGGRHHSLPADFADRLVAAVTAPRPLPFLLRLPRWALVAALVAIAFIGFAFAAVVAEKLGRGSHSEESTEIDRGTHPAYVQEETDTAFLVGSAINPQSYAMNVGDYVPRYTGTYNPGTGAMNVYGTFKPTADHDKFYGCTIQDGATIDLSERTTPLPCVSTFTTGSTNLTFADGATIYVKPRQPLPRRVPIISWDDNTRPANLGTLTFKSGDTGSGVTFIKNTDGLYPFSGMIILLR